MWTHKKLLQFEGESTPYLIIDLAIIEENYHTLKSALPPNSKIYYSVKANPSKPILKKIASLGSCFDIASIFELDQVLALGVSPNRISYGSTIKKEKDIAYAFEKGIRLYACDSEIELEKQSRAAPGSDVFFRLTTDGVGADWPLSNKFGSHPRMISKLICQVEDLGLNNRGLSFHVGSQQRDIGKWDDAISHCHHLFQTAREKGIELNLINLGGGLPSSYLYPAQSLKRYISEIYRFIEEDFGTNIPETIVEPGRALVGDAGVILSEIVLISKKSSSDLYNWVYLDVGIFGGLIEALGESIKYPIYSDRQAPMRKVILAGPTCDSMDILYQNHKYELPENIKVGDKLYIYSTGAYTTSYASVEFNGFPPLKSFYLSGE